MNNSVKASSQRTGIAARGFVTFIERSGVVFRVATCALTKGYQGDFFADTQHHRIYSVIIDTLVSGKSLNLYLCSQ